MKKSFKSQGNAPLVELDGRAGGGQILRTALTLSAITGQGFVLRHIRGARPRPGLMRQHLTAVKATAAICGADTVGATLGSRELTFRPGPLQSGTFEFAIGSAGSANLVLQTVLPALLCGPGPATVSVSGGTHNQSAPPFSFLEESWLPLLRKMGADLDLTLERWGFYPAGGGLITATVRPAPLHPIELLASGPLQSLRGVVASAHVGGKVARRELKQLEDALAGMRANWQASHPDSPDFPAFEREVIGVRDSPGPGNIAWLQIGAEHVTALFSSVGHKRRSAEEVGQDVVRQASQWFAAGAPVGPQLADQLLLPMAIAGGGRFRTTALTAHSRTQIETVQRFLPVRVLVEPSPSQTSNGDPAVLVCVEPNAGFTGVAPLVG